jgi:hypothetical protein
MTEHIAQMGPMLILAGLAAGWMAETVLRAGGYGSLRIWSSVWSAAWSRAPRSGC